MHDKLLQHYTFTNIAKLFYDLPLKHSLVVTWYAFINIVKLLSGLLLQV